MRFHIYTNAQRQQADPESSECSGRKPSPLLTKGEAERECSQSDSQHRRSKQIESLLLVPFRFLLTIEVKRSVEKEYANWHVDIKNPTPIKAYTVIMPVLTIATADNAMLMAE